MNSYKHALSILRIQNADLTIFFFFFRKKKIKVEMSNITGLDELKELAEGLESLNITGRQSQRRPSADKLQNLRTKKVVFEKCASDKDKIGFSQHTGPVQSDHKNFSHNTKYAFLQMSSPASATLGYGREKFDKEVNGRIEELKSHSKTVTTCENNSSLPFALNSNISIKLGYEYFFSRLFRFDRLFTVQEYNELELKKVTNTNKKYYRPVESLRNLDWTRVSDKYQLLRNSFTDHAGITNIDSFRACLTDMNFTEVESSTSFKILVNNKRQLFGKLLEANCNLTVDQVDQEVLNKIKAADVLSLKFDRNKKIKNVTFKTCKFGMYSANIDVLRSTKNWTDANDGSKKLEQRLLDVRYQFQQSLRIDAKTYDNFQLIECIFEQFLMADKVNSNCLVLKCQPVDIEFVRQKDFVKYESQTSFTVIKPECQTCDFIDYRVLKSMENSETILEPKEMVVNFIKSNIKLNRFFDTLKEDQQSDIRQELINEIWNFGMNLSDAASNYI